MFIVPSVAGCIMLLSTLLATQAALAGGLDGPLPPEALPPAPHAPHAHGTAFHFRPQHFPGAIRADRHRAQKAEPWRRYRARVRDGRVVPDSDIGANKISFVIETRWLSEFR